MKEIQIVVCMKQVPDPEAPPDAFKIDSITKKVIPIGVPPLLNPYDENALEAALRIKEHHSAKITVISVGEKVANAIMKKTIAAGADDLIIVQDPSFADLNSRSTAIVLLTAIKRLGRYDLILTGRQAGDWDFGVTGLLLAEMLEIPSISFARRIEIENEKILVEKLTLNGFELVESPMPVLVTVSSEIGELRYVSVRALQKVSNERIKVYNAIDLGIDISKLEKREILQLLSINLGRHCKFIEGESPQEKATNLAILMRKEGIL